MSALVRWWESLTPARPLYLWVLEQNEAAHRVYTKLGATKTGADVWRPPGGATLARHRLSWEPPGDVNI